MWSIRQSYSWLLHISAFPPVNGNQNIPAKRYGVIWRYWRHSTKLSPWNSNALLFRSLLNKQNQLDILKDNWPKINCLMWQSKVFCLCGLVPFWMKGKLIWNHWDGMSQRWTLVIRGAGQTHTVSLSSQVRKIKAPLCVLQRKSWIQNQELIQRWDELGGRGEKGRTGSEVVKLPLRVTRAAPKVRVVDIEPTAQHTWSSFQKLACKLLHSLRISEKVSLTSPNICWAKRMFLKGVPVRWCPNASREPEIQLHLPRLPSPLLKPCKRIPGSPQAQRGWCGGANLAGATPAHKAFFSKLLQKNTIWYNYRTKMDSGMSSSRPLFIHSNMLWIAGLCAALWDHCVETDWFLLIPTGEAVLVQVTPQKIVLTSDALRDTGVWRCIWEWVVPSWQCCHVVLVLDLSAYMYYLLYEVWSSRRTGR